MLNYLFRSYISTKQAISTCKIIHGIPDFKPEEDLEEIEKTSVLENGWDEVVINSYFELYYR